jgi:glucose uptake protein GlcU
MPLGMQSGSVFQLFLTSAGKLCQFRAIKDQGLAQAIGLFDNAQLIGIARGTEMVMLNGWLMPHQPVHGLCQ